MNSLQQAIDIPGAVYTIWAVTLGVAVLVILPITVLLLQRTLNAARNIERYMREMKEAGVGIAGNTSHITALDDTIHLAGQLLETAGSVKQHTATIKETLAERAAGPGG